MWRYLGDRKCFPGPVTVWLGTNEPLGSVRAVDGEGCCSLLFDGPGPRGYGALSDGVSDGYRRDERHLGATLYEVRRARLFRGFYKPFCP